MKTLNEILENNVQQEEKSSSHRLKERERRGEEVSCSSLPRMVIRGESSNTNPIHSPETYYLKTLSRTVSAIVAIPQPLAGTPGCSAITDYLNCTFPLVDNPDLLARFFRQFRAIVGDAFAPIHETGKGFHGWRRSFDLGESKGKFAIGGQRGTAYLSLTGQSCTLIPLDGWVKLRSLLQGEYNAKITRWDGAVDDYAGLCSVDWAVKQYEAGRFTTGGNKPSCNQHGNWIKPDGRGRTFEVGRRENGKLLRIYEKGKQLNNPDSPWVRWELELRCKDREIPWDVLTEAGAYVAGAYEATNWISKEVSRVKTFKKTAEISYDHLVHHAKRAYGPLLNVMLAVEGDSTKLVEKLISEGKPKRLQLPVPPELIEQMDQETSKE